MEMVWNLRESKISSLMRMIGAEGVEVAEAEVEVEDPVDVDGASDIALDAGDTLSDSAFVGGLDVLLAFEPTTPPTTAPTTTSSKMRAPRMMAVFLFIPHSLASFSPFMGVSAPASELAPWLLTEP